MQHKTDRQRSASDKTERTKWIEPRQPVATIKGLALGIFKGEIFTNEQIKEKDSHLLTSIFEPLEFMSAEDQHEWDKHPPSLIYAYSKDALNGRQINGYPVFDTVCTLWKSDAENVAAYHGQIRAAVEDALQGVVHYSGRAAQPIAGTSSPAAPKGKLQNVKDAAVYLGVSVFTVRSWIYNGRMTSTKLGSRVMIPTAELDRLIEENLRPASQKM